MSCVSTEPGGIVLVVDDSPRNLQILESILAPQRFEVVLADSGKVALDRIGKRAPDLVLLDLMMPGLDGMEVCRRLKSDPETSDIPVVFLTAANETVLASEAIRAGAVDYVTKPFNTRELLARVRAHVALKRTRDQLRRTIAEKNELMSTVAHDLKNPVAAVRETAVRLRDCGVVSPDPRAELVDEIVGSCDDALDFIEQCLERNARVFHMDSVRRMPFEPLEAVEAVLAQNAPAAARKAIVLEVEERDDAPSQVVADPAALVRVLSNLVSNAVKFSPPSRQVRIVVKRDVDAGFCRFEVRDQGPGLSGEDMQRLFKPFQRLSAQPTGGESSTGLGLSIARELTEELGGTIGFTPAPGGGACFWVRFPVATGPSEGCG